jgi:hypothetical protein
MMSPKTGVFINEARAQNLFLQQKVRTIDYRACELAMINREKLVQTNSIVKFLEE